MPLTRPQVIAPPTGPAVPFGLLSVAVTPPVSDPARWAGDGATWRAANCKAPAVSTGLCITEDDPVTPSLGPTGGVGQAQPFTVIGHDLCDPVGVDYADARERAERQVLLGESAAIEWAIETGLAGQVLPSLEQAADLTPTPGTAVDIDVAIAILEGAIGSVPGAGRGVLHMTRSAAIMADANGIELSPSGGMLTTILGTPVAAGGGYSGKVPLSDGAGGVTTPGDGEQWVYATGAPSVYRTPVEVLGDEATALDRANNNRLVEARREVLVAWDCLTVAVLATAPGVPTGTDGPTAVTGTWVTTSTEPPGPGEVVIREDRVLINAIDDDAVDHTGVLADAGPGDSIAGHPEDDPSAGGTLSLRNVPQVDYTAGVATLHGTLDGSVPPDGTRIVQSYYPTEG